MVSPERNLTREEGADNVTYTVGKEAVVFSNIASVKPDANI